MRAGAVKIVKGTTSWGCDAFYIENMDGDDCTMFWMEDWDDLLKAIEKMKPYMEAEKNV